MKHLIHSLQLLVLLLVAFVLSPCAQAQTSFPGEVRFGSSVVTNVIGLPDTVLLPASALTNYTLIATNPAVTINGTNAIRFTAVSGGVAGLKQFPVITITNLTGAPVTLAFTNTWVRYGAASGFVTNAKAAKIEFEVEGANVRYQVVEQQ